MSQNDLVSSHSMLGALSMDYQHMWTQLLVRQVLMKMALHLDGIGSLVLLRFLQTHFLTQFLDMTNVLCQPLASFVDELSTKIGK